MTIDTARPVGDLVAADPRRAPIFEDFGIDYCCAGETPLAEAATAAGHDLDAVTRALSQLPPEAPAPAVGPAENSALAHDIVDVHHAYMWEEMPRLAELVAKVHAVHGAKHPELAEVASAYAQAVAALDPHMTTEERKIFPAISRMEKTRTVSAQGSLAGPIAELRTEHDEIGRLFRHLRRLTNDYAAPADACTSYRLMLTGLEKMELDLHEHIHKENNILFRRSLELEDELRAAPPAATGSVEAGATQE